MIANIMGQLGNYKNAKIEESMVRHMILNALKSYNVKFSKEYGSIVIACDNGKIWRKNIFPYYKANRKKNNEKSEVDWVALYEFMAKIRAELKEYSPYRIIDVEHAEADDVIGALVNHFKEEKILILSGDKDFVQLHTDLVFQYDPTRTKWISVENPALFLKELILKGDSSDGIPNVLSADNCLVIGERQSSMTKPRIEKLMLLNSTEYDSSTKRNFDRNQQLIDLSFTPKEIVEETLKQYNEQNKRNRIKLTEYFMKYNLKYLISQISEF